ncbi:hypothetical protein J6590_104290 [Homalodisca vitripennis]|nr:hypothetical protein J6590_104290 [Homalodisca vitripennis]
MVSALTVFSVVILVSIVSTGAQQSVSVSDSVSLSSGGSDANKQPEDQIPKTGENPEDFNFYTVDPATLSRWSLPEDYLRASQSIFDTPTLDCPVGQMRDWTGTCRPVW